MKKLLLVLLFCTPCLATNRYILAGSSGTQAGTGCSDWTTANACPDLPSTLNRGDLYYVAGGTYGIHTFNDTDSGTTVIEIRAATIADHGTATGWSNALQGQAVFASTGSTTSHGALWEVTTDYYLFNGNGVRNADWQGGYLIRVSNTAGHANIAGTYVGLAASGGVVGSGTWIHNITFDYIEFDGSHSVVDTDNLADVFLNRCGSETIVRHSLIHDGGNDLATLKGKHDGLTSNSTGGLCNASSTGANLIFEYNYFFRNYSSSAQHGQAVTCDEGQYCIFRYNRFRDITGTAYFATDSAGGHLTNNIDNQWDVYGNWFEQKNTFNDNGVQCGVGGIIQCFDVNFSGALKFYNNTTVNVNTNICSNNQNGSQILIHGATGGLDCNLNAGLIVQNNLWYNSDAITADNTCGTCSTTTWDHNAYFTQTVTDTDSNKQVSATNPFVSVTNDDFHLTSDTNAGVTLSSPFNTDPDGKVRGSSAGGSWGGSASWGGNVTLGASASWGGSATWSPSSGIWDRGAFQK